MASEEGTIAVMMPVKRAAVYFQLIAMIHSLRDLRQQEKMSHIPQTGTKVRGGVGG